MHLTKHCLIAIDKVGRKDTVVVYRDHELEVSRFPDIVEPKVSTSCSLMRDEIIIVPHDFSLITVVEHYHVVSIRAYASIAIVYYDDFQFLGNRFDVFWVYVPYAWNNKDPLIIIQALVLTLQHFKS